MKPGFYNENEGRAYPFTDGASRGILPDEALVDFWSVLGLDTSNEPIVLLSVARAGSALTFTFAGPGRPIGETAPQLRFTALVTDPEFTTYSAVATDPSLGNAVYAPTCSDPLVWDGTMTIGRLAALAAAVPDATTQTIPATVVVASRVQDLNQTYVRSLSVANQLRLHATAPAGCAPPENVNPSGYSDGDYIYRQTCVIAQTSSTPLLFADGYNCTTAFDVHANAITFSAAPGAGLGAPCSEVPVYPGEAAPAGSLYLSGGPACNELITSLNGLAAARVRISPGTGITVAADEVVANQLNITLDQTGLAACGNSSLASLGSLSSQGSL